MSYREQAKFRSVMRRLMFLLGLMLAVIACGESGLSDQMVQGTVGVAVSQAIQAEKARVAATELANPTATPIPTAVPLSEQQVIGLFQQRVRRLKPQPAPNNHQRRPDLTVSCFGFLTSGEYWVTDEPQVIDWHARRLNAAEWQVWGNNLGVKGPDSAVIQYNFTEPSPQFPDGLWITVFTQNSC